MMMRLLISLVFLGLVQPAQTQLVVGSRYILPSQAYSYHWQQPGVDSVSWKCASEGLYFLSKASGNIIWLAATGQGPWALIGKGRDVGGRFVERVVWLEAIPERPFTILGGALGLQQSTDMSIELTTTWPWATQVKWKAKPSAAASIEALDSFGRRVRVHWHRRPGRVQLVAEGSYRAMVETATRRFLLVDPLAEQAMQQWHAKPDTFTPMPVDFMETSAVQPTRSKAAGLEIEYLCAAGKYWLLLPQDSLSTPWNFSGSDASNAIKKTMADTVIQQRPAVLVPPGRYTFARQNGLGVNIHLPEMAKSSINAEAATSVCEGKSIKMRAQVSGNHRWLWNFGDGSYSSLPVVTKSFDQTAAPITTLRTWNLLGCASDTHLQLHVQVSFGQIQLAGITQMNYSEGIDAQASTLLQAFYQGGNNAQSKWLWYSDDRLVGSSHTDTFRVNAPGYYHLQVYDAKGCKRSSGEKGILPIVEMSVAEQFTERGPRMQSCGLPPPALMTIDHASQ